MEAIAKRDQAERDLEHTDVVAPADGIVSQTDRLQVGQYMPVGTPVLALVETGDTWIEANFKETDLTHMTVGQPATFELDTYPGRELHGHGREHRRRHRLGVLAAAGAERDRQLGQGRAARAGAAGDREAAGRRAAARRHERQRRGRHRPRARPALARSARRSPGPASARPPPATSSTSKPSIMATGQHAPPAP